MICSPGLILRMVSVLFRARGGGGQSTLKKHTTAQLPCGMRNLTQRLLCAATTTVAAVVRSWLASSPRCPGSLSVANTSLLVVTRGSFLDFLGRAAATPSPRRRPQWSPRPRTTPRPRTAPAQYATSDRATSRAPPSITTRHFVICH